MVEAALRRKRRHWRQLLLGRVNVTGIFADVRALAAHQAQRRCCV
jgi:class 3 adenylate cyclase